MPASQRPAPPPSPSSTTQQRPPPAAAQAQRERATGQGKRQSQSTLSHDQTARRASKRFLPYIDESKMICEESSHERRVRSRELWWCLTQNGAAHSMARTRSLHRELSLVTHGHSMTGVVWQSRNVHTPHAIYALASGAATHMEGRNARAQETERQKPHRSASACRPASNHPAQHSTRRLSIQP